MRLWWFLSLLLLVVLQTAPARADHLVADTEPLTPADQLKKFHLPPGFEIQLVAQEPDVHKPMNMKFDVHGRIWVTHSLEYPFPAKEDAKARDAITIFSNLGEDGRAKTVHRFAEELNIPIGVLPLSDQETLAWSIPHIYRLIDTNGDGVADERKSAFGPFDFRDTHGNQNAFTRWIDGWVYANHGFNNDSHVKIGADGEPVIHLNSGNTYRFRADGSAIEQFSWGQVNPFGLSFDPLGNLYSADCHSRPVTMLLREGYYQSFGKPHDGLGYAPETTTIDHGGTGIAGVVYSTFPTWPKEFRDVLLVGNVITNRVHCDRLKWNGSSPTVEKVTDFLTCDDPWFRPVDLQQGPDGALYIADFYNCIIGHYEVPLTHPKRDRERGRIWRVVYKGGGQGISPALDLAKLSADELMAQLGHINLTVRMQATNELLDRFAGEAGAKARKLLSESAALKSSPEFDPAAQRAHAIWVTQRSGHLDESLARQLATEESPIVRVHLVRALGELTVWDAWQFGLVRGQLKDADPFVRRAAAEALAKHPSPDNIQPLLTALASSSDADVCLVHTTRISLRDQLRSNDVIIRWHDLAIDEAGRRMLTELLVTVVDGPASQLLIDEALDGKLSDEMVQRAFAAAAGFVAPSKREAMIAFVGKRFADSPERQLVILTAMTEGLARQKVEVPASMRAMIVNLIRPMAAGDITRLWFNSTPELPSPWILQEREYADGVKGVPTLSSLRIMNPDGEKLTGTLRSPQFELPPRLSFWMCGHSGLPKDPENKLCYVRLVLDDGSEAARSYPPRSDIAQRFEWDLSQHAGKRGHVEVVDTDRGAGFAWLAVARFEPPVITVPRRAVGTLAEETAQALKLAGQLKLQELAGDISRLAENKDRDSNVRIKACEALLSISPNAAVPPLAGLMADASLPIPLREQSAQQLGRCRCDEANAALIQQLKTAPTTVAVQIAAALAMQAGSAELLLKEVGEGRASPELLREPVVAERLKQSGIADIQNRIAELTKNLSPTDSRLAKLIEARRKGYLAANASVDAGREVFAKSVCANCHRVGEVGKQIGPALDGIGNRGLDRLLEDVLDPNRNVDQAFRTISLATDEGQVLSGFGLREEGAVTVLNDSKGEQVRVSTEEIVERKTSTLSPMPANVIEQIPPQDFYNLIAYLLSQRSSK